MEDMDTNEGAYLSMAQWRDKLYCGPLSLERRNILGSCRDNTYSWFNGTKVYYVTTARTAIYRLCELLNIKTGDEILAPSYSCGAELDALLQSGATVKLFDIEPLGCINTADLFARVSEKTRIIYITHYFGFPQATDVLRKFCDDRGIYFVEDCALALFSGDGTSKIGMVGDISVFNFPKFLPVPDGGVLCINNPKLAAIDWQLQAPAAKPVVREVLPLLKRHILRSSSSVPLMYSLMWSLLHKSHRHLPDRTKGPLLREDMPESYYYSEQLTDKAVSSIAGRIAATISVEEVVSRRRANFQRYLDLLGDVKNVRPLYGRLPAGVNPLSFPIIVKHRQWICDELNELSIAAIPWWAGYHRQMPWQEFPNACFLKDNLLTLPVHQQLETAHIEYISKKVIELVNWHI